MVFARPVRWLQIGIAGALVLFALPAFASHQPMLIGTQTISLAARGTAEAVAYCLDRALAAPTSLTALPHVLAGDVKVCNGTSCTPLQSAINTGKIRVAGTDGYGIQLENRTDQALTVRVDKPSVLGDTARTIKAPTSVPAGAHDGLAQYRFWRNLGQAKAMTDISVTQDGKTFTIEAMDRSGHAPVVIEGVRGDALGAILSELGDRNTMMAMEVSLPPDRARALLADLRLRTGMTGRSAIFKDGSMHDIVDPVKLGRETTSIVSDREVHAKLDLQTATDAIPTQVIVEFQEASPRPLLEKARDAISRGLDKVRQKSLLPPPDAASSVRDAVRDEVRALGRGRKPETVWIILGNEANGYFIVRIPAAASWAA